MLTIKHKTPTISGFWPIVYPCTGEPLYEKVSIRDDELKLLKLQDPETGEETLYEIHDVWRLDSTDGLGEAFSKFTYGISNDKLMAYLQERYPDWDGKLVEFILVKEHERKQ